MKAVVNKALLTEAVRNKREKKTMEVFKLH